MPHYIIISLYNHYIINLPRRSSNKYPRDIKWMVDGLKAIHSVLPRAAYEEWFKTLVTLTNHQQKLEQNH